MNRVGDLTDPRIAALYARVPPDKLEDFQAFRQSFPYSGLLLDGVDWSYLIGGEGDQTVLLLSGALVMPDISYNTIRHLGRHWRVIAPAYPPLTTIADLVQGITAILESEDTGPVHVIGGSYGGFVAQVFVRRHPELTYSLVLSHTKPPYPEQAKGFHNSAQMMRWLPMGMIRGMVRRSFSSLMPEWSEDTACLLSIYDELLNYTLTKQDAIAILERMADFSLLPVTPQDLAMSGFTGKTLLVFGENDPASPPEVRQRMQELYPDSQVNLFSGSGHTTSVTNLSEYQALIEEFLTTNNPGAPPAKS